MNTTQRMIAFRRSSRSGVTVLGCFAAFGCLAGLGFFAGLAGLAGFSADSVEVAAGDRPLHDVLGLELGPAVGEVRIGRVVLLEPVGRASVRPER